MVFDIVSQLRSKVALSGYAKCIRERLDNNIGLFHFSEQNWLDTDTLGEHLLSSTVSEVTVLLLATAASSFLWFDAEHCPRHVELCTFLKSHSMSVKFVVCPTTKSARDAWEQHSSNLPSVFGEFVPETGNVDIWPDFDPDHPVDSQQIRSLVHQVRHVNSSPPRKSQDLHNELRSSWFWNSLPIALALFALFGYLRMYWQLESLQKMAESEKEKRIAALAEVKRLNQTLSAEREQHQKRCEDADCANCVRLSEQVENATIHLSILVNMSFAWKNLILCSEEEMTWKTVPSKVTQPAFDFNVEHLIANEESSRNIYGTKKVQLLPQESTLGEPTADHDALMRIDAAVDSLCDLDSRDTCDWMKREFERIGPNSSFPRKDLNLKREIEELFQVHL